MKSTSTENERQANQARRNVERLREYEDKKQAFIDKQDDIPDPYYDEHQWQTIDNDEKYVELF